MDMRYAEFKKYWQGKFDALPMKAAFGERQFKEMMESWGLTTSDEDLKKIRPLVGGAFCLAEDEHLFYEWADEQSKAQAEFLSDGAQLKDALMYEFANYECGYTMNPKEGVLALFDEEEVETNELLKRVFPVAWKEYLERCE